MTDSGTFDRLFRRDRRPLNGDTSPAVVVVAAAWHKERISDTREIVRDLNFARSYSSTGILAPGFSAHHTYSFRNWHLVAPVCAEVSCNRFGHKLVRDCRIVGHCCGMLGVRSCCSIRRQRIYFCRIPGHNPEGVRSRWRRKIVAFFPRFPVGFDWDERNLGCLSSNDRRMLVCGLVRKLVDWLLGCCRHGQLLCERMIDDSESVQITEES